MTENKDDHPIINICGGRVAGLASHSAVGDLRVRAASQVDLCIPVTTCAGAADPLPPLRVWRASRGSLPPFSTPLSPAGRP